MSSWPVSTIVPLTAAAGVAALFLAAKSLKNHNSNDSREDGASELAPSPVSNLRAHILNHAPPATIDFNAMRRYAQQHEQEFETDRPVKIIVVGAGNRGKVYATYALEHPSRAQVFASLFGCCSNNLFVFTGSRCL